MCATQPIANRQISRNLRFIRRASHVPIGNIFRRRFLAQPAGLTALRVVGIALRDSRRSPDPKRRNRGQSRLTSSNAELKCTLTPVLARLGELKCTLTPVLESTLLLPWRIKVHSDPCFGLRFESKEEKPGAESTLPLAFSN